jgi:hypothetical protein
MDRAEQLGRQIETLGLHDLATDRALLEEIDLTNGAQLTIMLNQLIEILAKRMSINFKSESTEDKVAQTEWHESLLKLDERFDLQNFVERAIGQID